MSELLPPIGSWFELYQRLAMLAESTRGMITVTDPNDGTVSFPRTTVEDAFKVTLVFEPAIYEHGSDELVSRWDAESELLGDESPDATWLYVGSRSFWASVAAAATELDQAKVPLPGSHLIDDAMAELRTPRQLTEPRNSGCALATKFPESSWREMAKRQLEFFRDLRGVERDTRFLPDVPHTCNADVLMLAQFWTEQIARVGRRAEETCGRLAHSCWRAVMACAQRNALGMPYDTFPENEPFWSALLLLATQSDACNEHTAPWVFRGPRLHPRNLAPVDNGLTLDFPAAKTWDEAAQMQRDAFVRLRDADVVTGRLISRVPRTTISDVRQVAAYWKKELARVGDHGLGDVSYRHVIERWRAALAEVERIPAAADPNAVYAHNVDLWEAVMTIAIQIAVTDEAPSRWTLAKEATKQAISNLPDTLRTAVADFASQILAKPLLYAGVGLGGLAALVFMLRRPAPLPTATARYAPRPERESRE